MPYPRAVFRCLALAALLSAPAAAAAAPQAVAHRIVSLVPSLTEDLFALGAGARVVGVSAFSDYPAAAKKLPVVATFGSVDAERIVALHPDAVVGIRAQLPYAKDLRRAGLRVILLDDDTLDDLYADLTALGDLTGRRAEALRLVARLKARTAQLARSAPHTGASLFVVLGTAPIFTVGRPSYIARLIALAGARNASDDVREPYARYSAEALLARQPDALIVDPDVHIETVVAKEPWRSLRAVRAGFVDHPRDVAILMRPGPRYNEGLAWLIAFAKRVR